MATDLEYLTKTLHSIQFAISDLNQLVKSDNLSLAKTTAISLNTLLQEEIKFTDLIDSLEETNIDS